jgi:hypothetical protein
MNKKRLSWRFAGAKRLGSRLNQSPNCQSGVMILIAPLAAKCGVEKAAERRSALPPIDFAD